MKGYYKLTDEDYTLYLKVDCVINGKAICSAIEFGELGFTIEGEIYLEVDALDEAVKIKKSEFYNKLNELIKLI